LLQLDSTFSERNYGASSFLDFAEKLAKESVVTLKHAGRSVMVELNGAFTDGGAATETVETPPPADNGASGRPHDTQQAQRPEPVAATESAAAGVARAAQILAAAKSARWPMYLRNVKQILRQAEGGFDERRYGFNGLMDLLKALQRESTVRIERDRRGGLRVFQGSALQRHAQSVPMEGLPKIDPALEAEMAEAGLVPDVMPAVVIEQRGEADADPSLDGPMPIDTTAELLGRAKARKPRVAAGRMPRVAVAGTRKAAKKPAARRTSRARKAAEETQEDSDS
jgi:hypothetical protein